MSCKTKTTNMRNFRFPHHVLDQLNELAESSGMTKTAVLVSLIEREHDAIEKQRSKKVA